MMSQHFHIYLVFIITIVCYPHSSAHFYRRDMYRLYAVSFHRKTRYETDYVVH